VSDLVKDRRRLRDRCTRFPMYWGCAVIRRCGDKAAKLHRGTVCAQRLGKVCR